MVQSKVSYEPPENIVILNGLEVDKGALFVGYKVIERLNNAFEKNYRVYFRRKNGEFVNIDDSALSPVLALRSEYRNNSLVVRSSGVLLTKCSSDRIIFAENVGHNIIVAGLDEKLNLRPEFTITHDSPIHGVFCESGYLTIVGEPISRICDLSTFISASENLLTSRHCKRTSSMPSHCKFRGNELVCTSKLGSTYTVCTLNNYQSIGGNVQNTSSCLKHERPLFVIQMGTGAQAGIVRLFGYKGIVDINIDHKTLTTVSDASVCVDRSSRGGGPSACVLPMQGTNDLYEFLSPNRSVIIRQLPMATPPRPAE